MLTKVSRLKKRAAQVVLPWVNNCVGESEKKQCSFAKGVSG